MSSDSPDLSTRIQAVTVFTSGALVTRQGDLAALAGRPARVRISGLPLCLEDGSLRVRILGAAATARDAGISLEVPPADGTLPSAVPEPLRQARREEARLGLEVTLIENRLAQLDQIELPERPVSARGAPPLPLPTAARLALLDFRRREAAILMAERTRLREEHRLGVQRLQVLEAQEAIASNARQAREHQLRKTVVVQLEWSAQPAGGPCLLQLDYLVPGAQWVPSYTIRLDRALARGVVQVQGSVVQTSGEDWHGVQLTTSTADALAWSDLPELTSLRIGRRQDPPRRSGWREPPRGAEQLYRDFDASAQRFAPLAQPAEHAAQLRESDDLVPAKQKKVSTISPSSVAKSAGVPSLRDRADVSRGDGGAARAEGAAMPMATAPAPAPSVPPPPRVGAAFGGSAPSGAASRNLRRRSTNDESKRSKEEADEDFGDGAGGDRDTLGSNAPEPSGPPEPDRPAHEALAYRQLYLAGAQEPMRGQLTPMPAAMAYRSLSLRTQVAITVDIQQVIELASRQARVAGLVPLPARCQAPATPQFAYSFPAAAPASIPSDGIWHGVPLGESAAGIRLEHVAVPREGREVFRVLQLTSPFPTPLLAGPADVYREDDYLMTADLPLTVPSGVLELGLGVEQGITVARNTTYQEEATGMLSGTLALHHGIAITIANKLRVPVSIEVRERLPVATPGVEDCKVKVGAVQPPWEDFHQQAQGLEGGHRWKVQLPAGGTQTLSAAYVVSIPAKSEITAGNRREA